MAFNDKLRVSLLLFCLFVIIMWPNKPLYSYNSTGPEVGIAWLSQVCNTAAVQSGNSGDYTSGTGVSSISKLLELCGSLKY
jgi:hypothetical protein